ncbi:collagenase [Streptomyces sp. NPDC020800]|uniref:collagenase n=1 Tax=Streptomyces sp. NPDC020800 TaxID=3365092 RepID=UPI0037B5AE09
MRGSSRRQPVAVSLAVAAALALGGLAPSSAMASAGPVAAQQAAVAAGHTAKLSSPVVPGPAKADVGVALASSKPAPVPPPATAARTAAAAASCNVSDFTNNSGSALVNTIENSTQLCISSLFSIGGAANQQAAFSNAKMATVAGALNTEAASYNGTADSNTYRLALYLRAGYFNQVYSPTVLPWFDTTVQTAVRNALDTFFANTTTATATDSNGSTVAILLTLATDAKENRRYLYASQRYLNGASATFYTSTPKTSVVNSATENLWRLWSIGLSTSDAATAVLSSANPHLIQDISTFISSRRDTLLGTSGERALMNAVQGLALMLKAPTLQPTVRPLVLSLISSTSITGPTASLWLTLQKYALANDSANCANYATCGSFPEYLLNYLGMTSYICSPTITIVSKMPVADRTAACTSMTGQDAFFFNLVGTSTPVAGDNTVGLETDVFENVDKYKLYSPFIYGNSVDNGGISLEGNPSTPGNKAHFVAFQDPRETAPHHVWNLNHEYTHYLDARYDLQGAYYPAANHKTIWWTEGLAEYVMYSYLKRTNTSAAAEAPQHTYKLSELFNTTYGDLTRVYQWGYLAVRYMFEKHPADVNALLAKFRAGDYDGSDALLNSIGSSYDAGFTTWLDQCIVAGTNCGTSNPPVNQAPTAGFTSSVTGLTAAFTDTSTDADGSIASRSWSFGDGGTSTAASPTHAYTAAGTYTVTLTVTDDKGAIASTSKNVTVTSATTPPTVAECTDSDVRKLGKNCKRSNLSSAAGNLSYFYINIPAGTTQLTITTSGGTGDADLYYKKDTWASTTSYTSKATGPGNSHTLTVTNPPAGDNYITLHAAQAFNGVTLTTQY